MLVCISALSPPPKIHSNGQVKSLRHTGCRASAADVSEELFARLGLMRGNTAEWFAQILLDLGPVDPARPMYQSAVRP